MDKIFSNPQTRKTRNISLPTKKCENKVSQNLIDKSTFLSDWDLRIFYCGKVQGTLNPCIKDGKTSA